MKAVTLRLEDELFAIEAECVREILDPPIITRVPNASPFVGGLINVRGAVVPLADFRVMFGMDCRPRDQDTRIVVIELQYQGEAMTVGILADKVHDVTDIDNESIEGVPKVGMRWPPEFIRGIGKHAGKFVIIPEMGKIFEKHGGMAAPATSDERAVQ